MIVLAYVVSGCGSQTFQKLGRTLPDRRDVVIEPVRGNPKVEDRDLALIARDWRAVALENEKRLDISGCNYADVQASYAVGQPARTTDKFCVKLRKGK